MSLRGALALVAAVAGLVVANALIPVNYTLAVRIVAFTFCTSMFVLFLRLYRTELAGRWRREMAARFGELPVEGSIQALTGLARVIAGARHAHLREAWAADLFGDPDTGELPSARRRLGLASGDVAAAVRCRLDDVVAVAWCYADKVLSSWRRSRTAMVVPAAAAAVMIAAREGWYGLVTNAENLTCIATASYLAVRGLRGYRHIAAPKRPEKKPAARAGPEG